MGNLSFPTRIKSTSPTVEAQSLNHWTVGEDLMLYHRFYHREGWARGTADFPCIFFFLLQLLVILSLFQNEKSKLQLGVKQFLKFKIASGKGKFSFQSQRKAMPKNAQTTAQLHSSHTLVK